jgi:3',5'-cyclic AMP phosphodiesterase CpdA
MSLILHVSDTHFGTEQAPVVEALVALAARQRPDLVVLSGDITQRARPAQFRAAHAFVNRLGAPCIAIPGNHDIPLFDLWTRLTRPYARHRAAFGDELEPLHESDDLLVLGVNTTRAWRHVHGEISPAQVERVAACLARASTAQLRVIVVHQPIAVMRDEDRVNQLRGHAQALPRWATAGADLVLGGHIHLPYVMTVPSLPRLLTVVQAGTAVSHRVRPGVPNSVNLLRWQANTAKATAASCMVEQWDFDAAAQSFTRVRETTVRVARP